MTVATGTTRPKQQKKTFQSSLKKFSLIAVPAILVSAFLIHFGIRQHYLLRHDTGDFPPGWLFYLVPWGISAVLMVGVIAVVASRGGRKVLVAAGYIEVYKWGGMTRIPWQRLTFTPPSLEKKSMRTALISDGTMFILLEELFWPEFDLLVAMLAVGYKRSRESLKA